MQLITPTLALEASYTRYIRELGSEERYPFPLDFNYHDFAAMLAKIDDFEKGINLPKNAVCSSTYWLVEDNEIIGVTNIRHYLNAAIAHCGGHIGLSVLPSRRGDGVGRYLMRLSIDLLIARGVTDIHIHCHADNPRSAATIKACGGKLDSTLCENGQRIQRFRVEA